MSGGVPYLMHEIFQRHGIPPDEIYAKPLGAQRFMFASMTLVLEEEAEARKKAERERKKGG